MITRSLRNVIFRAFLAVIVVLGVSVGALGFYQLRYNLIQRSQIIVTNDLKFARAVYKDEISDISRMFKASSAEVDINALKGLTGLDYLYLVPTDKISSVKSDIVKYAQAHKKETGGSRIIGRDELKSMGSTLYERAEIEVQYTPKARQSNVKTLDRALAVECAMPCAGGILYGGKVINRDFELVDRIHSFIFEDRLYAGKPMGTVTIFLDDIRIATNVLDKDGKRAVGTRVSESVYDNVVLKDKTWLDRAFVVTDWYISGYEPIKDINGRIIGIIYVGLLEKPFNDMLKNILFFFTVILSCAVALAVFLSVILSRWITRPMTEMLEATEKISGGDLRYRLKENIPIGEIGRLAASFNAMAGTLYEREEGLKVANEKLAALNKSYIDMIGFVSHELKGILGSIIMNIYSVRDGYMGQLNDKQKKAIDAACRSLDHFENMVKNYLDLSRIERGKLEVSFSRFALNEDIIKPTVEHFDKSTSEKQIRLDNLVPDGIKLSADKNLMAVVCNNLLSNAVKYGTKGGAIRLEAVSRPNEVEIRFYNDGAPIPEGQKKMLFRRFSRLPGSEKAKGTGLGLFIVKEIIEKHGGNVWAESSGTGNTFAFKIPVSQ